MAIDYLPLLILIILATFIAAVVIFEPLRKLRILDNILLQQLFLKKGKIQESFDRLFFVHKRRGETCFVFLIHFIRGANCLL